jgi:lauroyl/myristoyl acyltransferase
MLKELGLIALVCASGIVALLLPERLWWPLAYGLARLTVPLRRRHSRSRRQRLEDWGLTPGGEADEIVVRGAANDLVSRFVGLRCALTRSWSPRVRLEGVEHIERALADGRGVILWVAPTSWHTVATKAALHGAGFGVSHLSTDEHGYAGSRVAVKLLNPLWVRGENRFLSERLVMSGGDRSAALRTLVDRVRAGGLVSITAGSQGQRSHEVPMLAGSIRLAAGAASLALRTGGVLLPVWSLRASDETFVTTIAPALQADDPSDRGRSEVAMTAAYAAVIAPAVADRPAEWQGWR